VYQAGTLSANPVSVRAGLATLTKMERIDGWHTLESRTKGFCDALAERLAVADPTIEIVRQASVFWLRKRSTSPVRTVTAIHQDQAPWYARFFHAALRRGVYLPPAAFEVCFLSMAHDDDTLALAMTALTDAATEAAKV
jgi:glutamate-1-semialdehyde 2,1-aminomutase